MSGADQLAPADDRATPLSAQQPMKFLLDSGHQDEGGLPVQACPPAQQRLQRTWPRSAVTQQQNGTDHDNR